MAKHLLDELETALEMYTRALHRRTDHAAKTARSAAETLAGSDTFGPPAIALQAQPSTNGPRDRASSGSPSPTPRTDLPPRLRRLFEASIDVPAGRSYYLDDDAIGQSSVRSVPPEPGHFTLFMHGHADCTTVGEEVLDYDDLALLIEADPKWNGEPVRLAACETGRGDYPIALELADRLEVNVLAPTEDVWCSIDGTVLVTEGVLADDGSRQPRLPETGGWTLFTPWSDEE